MNLPEKDTYSKHRYQINIVECAYEVVQRMKADKNRPKNQISVEEYAFRLREAINAYKWSIGFDPSASEVSRKQACVISPTHPAFDFWLALHLSIEDSDEIPMLLDAYNDDDFGYVENFLGHVQFLILKMMKSNELYDFKEQKKAVIEWVREQKAKHKDQKNIKEPQTTINIEALNLIKNEVSINVEIFNQIINLFQHFNFDEFANFMHSNYQKEERKEPNEDALKYKNSIPAESKIKNEDLIHTSCTYEKAFIHFRQLTKIKDEKNRQFLSDIDIEHFLLSNFAFQEKVAQPNQQPMIIEIAQRHLNQLFYDFYNNYDFAHNNEKKEVYFNLLKRTFLKQYKDSRFAVWKTNFAKKYSNYPFIALR
jgi:hypothetical protein